MGSQNIQGPLWGQYAANWANIQEQTGISGYQYALQNLQISTGDKLLDIGCGSGLFSSLANTAGAQVTGIDASGELIDQARKRAPGIHFITGDMEELPFADGSFNIVCGFNAFQYAANTANALAEANRVLQPQGKLVAMIWGNKADCEAASYLQAVGGLLPPPPPTAVASGPFALSENRLLETMLDTAGFTITQQGDVDAIWDYPNTETALKGLLAAGPAVKAINHSGYQQVYDTVAGAIKPYTQFNGHIVYHNKFRVIIAEKA